MTDRPPTLEELLNQPTSGADPYHPHLLVKPAADSDETARQAKAGIDLLVKYQREGRPISAALVDQLKFEVSSRVVQLGNAIPIAKPKASRGGKWSLDE